MHPLHQFASLLGDKFIKHTKKNEREGVGGPVLLFISLHALPVFKHFFFNVICVQ